MECGMWGWESFPFLWNTVTPITANKSFHVWDSPASASIYNIYIPICTYLSGNIWAALNGENRGERGLYGIESQCNHRRCYINQRRSSLQWRKTNAVRCTCPPVGRSGFDSWASEMGRYLAILGVRVRNHGTGRLTSQQRHETTETEKESQEFFEGPSPAMTIWKRIPASCLNWKVAVGDGDGV